MFCDEPTSGLDSFMALSVVECMKDLSKRGKTIISTIHQPSSEIFKMFDRICLMAEGKIAFIGDLFAANKFFRKYFHFSLFFLMKFILKLNIL